MIAVIADDFTGAAEIAGISLRYGLKVKVLLNNEVDDDADVVIICTDSRSMQKAAAVYCTADAVEAFLKMAPALWYKKIDSVLRGYVIAEAKVQMELMEKSKIFILPANPSLQRTISAGEYFINGKKITETGFVNDPEFPVQSAKVAAMVHDATVQVLQHDDWLPVEGMVIGEAKTKEDITAWAAALDTSWMLVGAGDFYTALLEKQYAVQQQQSFVLQQPHLYVCGTAFDERKKWIRQVNEKHGHVAYLPQNDVAAWIPQAGQQMREQQKLIIAIDESSDDALTLRTNMADAVQQIVEQEGVKEIFIEGGSTAAAILQAMNISMLSPVNELSRGVVRMKVNDLFITVKPGSYPLSDEIIQLYAS